MIDFTHQSVLDGIRDGADWADPCMNPTEIDWAERLAQAWIPFPVVNGRPVNPFEDTGIDFGRNEMGHWAEGRAADALVVAERMVFRWWMIAPRWRRYVVLVERGDDHGWAMPGGMVEPGELGIDTAIREAREEAGLDLSKAGRHIGDARYAPDPRGSNEAWIVTRVVRFYLAKQVPLTGGDDARRAEWVRADTYAHLERDVRRRLRGRVFPAHVEMLREVLG